MKVRFRKLLTFTASIQKFVQLRLCPFCVTVLQRFRSFIHAATYYTRNTQISSFLTPRLYVESHSDSLLNFAQPFCLTVKPFYSRVTVRFTRVGINRKAQARRHQLREIENLVQCTRKSRHCMSLRRWYFNIERCAPQLYSLLSTFVFFKYRK